MTTAVVQRVNSAVVQAAQLYHRLVLVVGSSVRATCRSGRCRSCVHQPMVRGGLPCTITEPKERFDACVADLTRGRDPAKVRIVLE